MVSVDQLIEAEQKRLLETQRRLEALKKMQELMEERPELQEMLEVKDSKYKAKVPISALILERLEGREVASFQEIYDYVISHKESPETSIRTTLYRMVKAKKVSKIGHRNSAMYTKPVN